jgi:hypothetical protein
VLVKATDKQTDQNLGVVAALQVSSVSVHKGWGRTWGGLLHDQGLSVAIDSSGNAYMAGGFMDSVDFDPGAGVDNHASNGWVDAFLSKLDSDGNFVWARTWGGLYEDSSISVAIDGLGNLYVTGRYTETADFDPGAGVDSHTSNGSQDVFLSKFDPDGNFIWARTWGGLGQDDGRAVAIDGSGNVYITGFFYEEADLDPGAGVDDHITHGGFDVFLSKFDPDGNYVWARTWGGIKDDFAWSVAIDGAGNSYVAGSFWDTVDFDPGAGVDNHTSTAFYDASLSKFDPSGDFVWARTWGGSGDDRVVSVAVDGFGNPCVAGFFRDAVDFDPGAGVDNHLSNGLDDAFLSMFDPSGNFIWARTWGGPADDEGISVAIDGFSNAYITGIFSGTVDFDPGPGVDGHLSNGNGNAYLSKLDQNGNFVWARTWGGLGTNGESDATDGIGNAYVIGYFYDIVDLDPGADKDYHTSNGYGDVYLSKFPPDGNW